MKEKEPQVVVDPLKLAGLLETDEKESFLFTLKVATAMIYSRKLGVLARKAK